MPADGAGDGGSCTLPRTGNIVPALAATFCSKASVKLHGQTQSSSESSVSGTTSIASRQRRAATAAARRALAEARLEEIEANNDLAAGSTAGSVGRRMDDVRSDPDDDASHLMVSTEETREHPTSPIQLSERTESASTSEARTPTPTSIYEDFSQRVGNTATNDVFSFNNTLPLVPLQRSTSTAEAGSIPQTINDLFFQGSPTTEVGIFPSTRDVDMDTPINVIGEGMPSVAETAAATPTYILNNIINNHDGCSFGHIAQSTHMHQSAVDNAIHVAEELHRSVIHEVLGSANQAPCSTYERGGAPG